MGRRIVCEHVSHVSEMQAFSCRSIHMPEIASSSIQVKEYCHSITGEERIWSRDTGSDWPKILGVVRSLEGVCGCRPDDAGWEF